MLEKIKKLKTAVIILSILCFLLVAVIAMGLFWIIRAHTVQYAPCEGVWYCEDLGLKLSFERNGESVWDNNGTLISCTCISHKQSPYLNIYEIDEVIHINYGTGTAYKIGTLLFNFEITSYSDQSFVVDDRAGNTYTFLRATHE